jgi:hypothetical protein
MTDYRRFPIRCARIARTAASVDEAKAFAAMAGVWEKLAVQEEHKLAKRELRFIDSREAPSVPAAHRH